MTFLDCTADLVGQLNGNGQKGILQITHPRRKIWLHHWTKLLWNKLPEELVSASSVSAFISRLNSTNVSFLMFCFSAVCFFICVSFDAVVKVLFEPFCPVDTVLLFTVFIALYLC